jgi:hypothetical protein
MTDIAPRRPRPQRVGWALLGGLITAGILEALLWGLARISPFHTFLAIDNVSVHLPLPPTAPLVLVSVILVGVCAAVAIFTLLSQPRPGSRATHE